MSESAGGKTQQKYYFLTTWNKLKAIYMKTQTFIPASNNQMVIKWSDSVAGKIQTHKTIGYCPNINNIAAYSILINATI